MEIFNETFGMDAGVVKSFIEWLLTFMVSLFCVVVLKGSYSRLINNEMNATDVFIDVVVCIALATLVFVVID